MLRWARENNCPWSSCTTLHAAMHSHLEVLEWARQQQTPIPWWSLKQLPPSERRQLIQAKPRTLLWLAQQGAPLPDEAYAIACSSANRLTYAYIALRPLLPADILNHVLALSLE